LIAAIIFFYPVQEILNTRKFSGNSKNKNEVEKDLFLWMAPWHLKCCNHFHEPETVIPWRIF
jgi:hypothetical protein